MNIVNSFNILILSICEKLVRTSIIYICCYSSKSKVNETNDHPELTFFCNIIVICALFDIYLTLLAHHLLTYESKICILVIKQKN